MSGDSQGEGGRDGLAVCLAGRPIGFTAGRHEDEAGPLGRRQVECLLSALLPATCEHGQNHEGVPTHGETVGREENPWPGPVASVIRWAVSGGRLV